MLSTQIKSVDANSLVYIDLKLTTDDGVTINANHSEKPVVICLGDGSMSDAFEHHVVGMMLGQEKSFRLESADALGEYQPNLVQFMDLHSFPNDIELAEGIIIEFAAPNGEPMPGVVKEVAGHSVKVDFNHPFAGEAITFNVLVRGIDQPPEV